VSSPADLRAWITLLEREDELVRVAAEVDPDLDHACRVLREPREES
jgi:3-polyprenyl-4-hydroxybenzoate decarboxylase